MPLRLVMPNLIQTTVGSATVASAGRQSLGSLSDADLLDGWAHDREQEAFSELVRRYSRLVLSVCRRRCRSASDADDAFQCTFLYLAKNCHRIRHPERLPGWLHRVSQRAAVATFSAHRHDAHPMTDPLAKPDDPLGGLSQRHEAMVLDEELADLPEHYRVALVLHIMEGYSLERVAEHLGSTTGSVRGQLQRGKRMLARRLRRRGVVPVLAIASTMASTVAGASASLAGESLLLSFHSGKLPDPPIDTSHLDSLLHQGFRIMKIPVLSGVAVTAVILTALIVLADGGDGGQPTEVSDVIELSEVAIDASVEASIAGMASESGTSMMGDDGVQTSRTGMSQAATRPASAPPASSPLKWVSKSVIPEPTSKIAIEAQRALDEVQSFSEALPLIDLAKFLSQATGSPAWLDQRAMTLSKLEPKNSMIQFDSPNFPLSAALHKVLHPLSLRALVTNEGILITADTTAQVRSGIHASRWINVDEDAEKRIAQSLEQVVSVNFVEESLENAIKSLEEGYRLRMSIDRKSLEEVGLSVDTPIWVSLKDVKLKSVLSAMLDDLNLTYTVQNETLQITTPESEESRLLIRIYWLEGTGVPLGAYDEVMTLIQSTIVPDTWESLGGPSTMSPIMQGIRPAMAVRSSYQVHQQIENMFSRLRDAHFGPDPVSQPVQVPADWTPAKGDIQGPGVGGIGPGGMGGDFGGDSGGGMGGGGGGIF